jgi:copper chaperone
MGAGRPRDEEVVVMETERFRVKNVKCGGCASTIQDGLLGLAGVKDVAVVIQGGEVTVSGEALDRAALSQKLGQLGYPEAA